MFYKSIILFISILFIVTTQNSEERRIISQAHTALYQLFESNKDFIPQNIQILDILFNKNYAILSVNLSNEATTYGGSYFEYRFINNILYKLRQISEISYLNILIEGKLVPFPEGHIIFWHKL